MTDSKINEELKQRFSPIGSSLYKHQKRLLDILVYIDKICRDNKITYWLSSGTALGAIRHGGFIPWDDDVDIEMTMKDYKKFESIMLKDKNYLLQTRKTDPYYSAPYAKVRDKHSIIEEHPQDGNYKMKGVYVDVFIIEKNPSRIVSAIYTRATWNLVLEGGKAVTIKDKLKYKIKKSIIYFTRDIFRLLFLIIPTKKYRHTLGGGFHLNIRNLEDIIPVSEMMFEGHMFCIPKNYNNYLKAMYGDYMKLPDLSKIHPHISKVTIEGNE